MTAPRSLVCGTIMGRLRAIPGVAEVERMPSGDPLTFPALHFFDDGHRIGELEAGATRYDMLPTIVGYVEGEGGDEAHDALIDLYSLAVAALLTDPPLDGVAETIDEGNCKFMVAPLASKRRLAFALELPITFAAKRGNPAQAA